MSQQDEVPLADLAGRGRSSDSNAEGKEAGTAEVAEPTPPRQLRQTRSRTARSSGTAVKPAAEVSINSDEEDVDIDGLSTPASQEASEVDIMASPAVPVMSAVLHSALPAEEHAQEDSKSAAVTAEAEEDLDIVGTPADVKAGLQEDDPDGDNSESEGNVEVDADLDILGSPPDGKATVKLHARRHDAEADTELDILGEADSPVDMVKLRSDAASVGAAAAPAGQSEDPPSEQTIHQKPEGPAVEHRSPANTDVDMIEQQEAAADSAAQPSSIPSRTKRKEAIGEAPIEAPVQEAAEATAEDDKDEQPSGRRRGTKQQKAPDEALAAAPTQEAAEAIAEDAEDEQPSGRRRGTKQEKALDETPAEVPAQEAAEATAEDDEEEQPSGRRRGTKRKQLSAASRDSGLPYSSSLRSQRSGNSEAGEQDEQQTKPARGGRGKGRSGRGGARGRGVRGRGKGRAKARSPSPESSSAAEQDQADFADALDSPSRSQQPRSPGSKSAQAAEQADEQPGPNRASPQQATTAKQTQASTTDISHSKADPPTTDDPTPKDPVSKRHRKAASATAASGPEQAEKGGPAARRKRQKKAQQADDVAMQEPSANADIGVAEGGATATEDKEADGSPEPDVEMTTAEAAHEDTKVRGGKQATTKPRRGKKVPEKGSGQIGSQSEDQSAAVGNPAQGTEQAASLTGLGTHTQRRPSKAASERPLIIGDGPLQRAETQHRALEDNMKAFEEARLVVEQARADLAAAEQSFGKSVEQVEANLGDIDQLSLSMEILRTVGLGKAVSKLAKLPQAHPAFAECQRIALKASSVSANMKVKVGWVSKQSAPSVAQSSPALTLPASEPGSVAFQHVPAPQPAYPVPQPGSQELQPATSAPQPAHMLPAQINAEHHRSSLVKAETSGRPLDEARSRGALNAVEDPKQLNRPSSGPAPVIVSAEQAVGHLLHPSPVQSQAKKGAIRSKAVMILQLAFAGPAHFSPSQAAEALEDVVFAEFAENGVPGIRYKRRLHALWASLNSSTAVPALREKVLQGEIHMRTLAKIDRAQISQLCKQAQKAVGALPSSQPPQLAALSQAVQSAPQLAPPTAAVALAIPQVPQAPAAAAPPAPQLQPHLRPQSAHHQPAAQLPPWAAEAALRQPRNDVSAPTSIPSSSAQVAQVTLRHQQQQQHVQQPQQQSSHMAPSVLAANQLPPSIEQTPVVRVSGPSSPLDEAELPPGVEQEASSPEVAMDIS